MAETYKTHPITGEEGVWRYMAGFGWVDVDPNKITQTTTGSSFKDVYDPPAQQLGPRTHYDTGEPIADFKTPSHLNPNWSIRLNDLMSLVGQGSGSGRTMWSEEDKPSWTSTDPYWRTEEGRQWISDQAIGGKDLNSIVSEMQEIEASRNAVASSATQATTDPASMASMGGATGGYALSTPMTLGYQAPSLSSISATGGVDYVKMLNSALAADVMSGMLTGRGRIV